MLRSTSPLHSTCDQLPPSIWKPEGEQTSLTCKKTGYLAPSMIRESQRQRETFRSSASVYVRPQTRTQRSVSKDLGCFSYSRNLRGTIPSSRIPYYAQPLQNPTRYTYLLSDSFHVSNQMVGYGYRAARSTQDLGKRVVYQKQYSDETKRRLNALYQTGERGLDQLQDNLSLKKAPDLFLDQNVKEGYTLFPSQRLITRANKVASFAQPTVQKNGEEYASALLKGPIGEYLYCAGDLASLPRVSYSLVDAALNLPDPGGLSALGFSSTFSVITGCVAASRGYESLQKAYEIDDIWGQHVGHVLMTRGAVETVSGVVYIPARALSLAATQTSAKGVVAAAGVLGQTASALSGVTYLLMIIPSAMSCYKGSELSQGLTDVLDGPSYLNKQAQYKAALMFLMDQLVMTEDEYERSFQKVFQDENILKGEIEDGDFSKEDESLLSSKESLLIKMRVLKEFPSLSETDQLKLMRRVGMEFKKVKLTKEKELERGSGPETVRVIKEELTKPLQDRLVHRLFVENQKEAALEEAQEVIKLAKSEIDFNLFINGTIIFLCVVGIIGFILGMVATGGGLAVAAAAIWVAVSVGMLMVDAYFLYQSYQNEQGEFKDKLIACIVGGVMLMAVILAIVFSGGIAGVALSAVVGLMWLTLLLYTLYRWNQKVEDQDRPSHNQATFGIPPVVGF